jgi:hypothetical protein
LQDHDWRLARSQATYACRGGQSQQEGTHQRALLAKGEGRDFRASIVAT